MAAVAVPFLIVSITQLFASSLSNSLIVLAAFDTKIGRRGRLGVYIEQALANIVTVVLMSLAVIIVMAAPIFVVGVSIFALVASGAALSSGLLIVVLALVAIGCLLYFGSAFSPLVPAIVIEGAGFGAMGRAWGLTSGYRWRIAGVLLVLLIAEALVGMVGEPIGRLFAAIGGEWLAELASLAVNTVAGGHPRGRVGDDLCPAARHQGRPRHRVARRCVQLRRPIRVPAPGRESPRRCLSISRHRIHLAAAWTWIMSGLL